jgi:hypothetical protein
MKKQDKKNIMKIVDQMEWSKTEYCGFNHNLGYSYCSKHPLFGASVCWNDGYGNQEKEEARDIFMDYLDFLSLADIRHIAVDALQYEQEDTHNYDYLLKLSRIRRR